MYIRLYRDAAATDGGGAILPPSLADLDNPPQDPQDPQDPNPQDPPEGLDPEGNLLEGYEKLEDGTIQKIADPTDPPADEPLSADDFWNAVNQATGLDITVDYGDVDPLSIEGAVLRERAVREHEINRFEEHLRESNPRAYAYMLHVQNGGSDEEFFGNPAPGLPAREEFLADPDSQANLIFHNLVNRGVPEAVAKATVDNYIKENQLQENAVKLYDEQLQENKKKLEEVEQRTKKQQAEFAQSIQNISASIQQAMDNQMRLMVPDTQKAAFGKFVMDHLQHDGENFYIVTPIDKDLNSTLDGMYLNFKKGNLADLIEREAKTKAVQRLGARVAKDKQAAKGGEGSHNEPKFVTFGSI